MYSDTQECKNVEAQRGGTCNNRDKTSLVVGKFVIIGHLIISKQDEEKIGLG